MQRLLETLRRDKELQELREEWKKRMNTPFPGYNYDEYGGIEDYKEKIKLRLKCLQ